MSELTFRAAIELDNAFIAAAFNRSFEGYIVAMQFDARTLEMRARTETCDFDTSFIAFRDDDVAGILCTETIGNLTLPCRAFRLEGKAFVMLGDPSAERVGIRGCVVRRADRRRRHGTHLLQALFAKFPGKTWAVSPIVPAGLADAFFLANGFVESRLAQLEMRIRLANGD